MQLLTAEFKKMPSVQMNNVDTAPFKKATEVRLGRMGKEAVWRFREEIACHPGIAATISILVIGRRASPEFSDIWCTLRPARAGGMYDLDGTRGVNCAWGRTRG